jgi:hypothetical protein
MGCSRQLQEPGARDVLREVTPVPDDDPGIVGLVNDQRRNPDRRQGRPHVDRGVQPVELCNRAGADRVPEDVRPRAGLVLVGLHECPGGKRLEPAGLAPVRLVFRGLSLTLLNRRANRIVGGRHGLGLSAAKDESGRALGVRRREQDRHRRAFRYAHQRRSLRAHGVHHGPDVVHPLLERHRLGEPVGHSSPALVEQDEPREPGETLRSLE